MQSNAMICYAIHCIALHYITLEWNRPPGLFSWVVPDPFRPANFLDGQWWLRVAVRRQQEAGAPNKLPFSAQLDCGTIQILRFGVVWCGVVQRYRCCTGYPKANLNTKHLTETTTTTAGTISFGKGLHNTNLCGHPKKGFVYFQRNNTFSIPVFNTPDQGGAGMQDSAAVRSAHVNHRTGT
mmetsp:Transcript_7703/g.22544  ORF Transcript_7703/g.22544 Transcript_7703/m.22544 type:complete len:181 (-) Transcript_7703:212-754(-)